ncbi:hypothetical protein CNMCM5793_001583 [Aspergillus hiratsukae]|uniref:T6SS Phospholipase effector Tle1-like catalytic domain-containing protein n=1 Tax=Aspergillus hiratsukae TaxID=1194566 RepID=A0A8H6PZA9_9EURO|nr:hypothetical protein CNMCM5793_001583 [Aspergillus hiratsukae]KAF7164101.1 hypothetical protein CNMCM6106_000759 [Aspergillus hiratsukae]
MGTYNQHNATREYSEGNPALPRPGSDKQGRIDIDIQTRKPKKFIILCDGTGQDSSGGTAQNPTNVTRLGRALAPNCWVKKEKGSNTNEQDQAEDDQYEEWEQIVSYHAGVGTLSGNNAFGVIFGNGLSEIVRSAYGFLASNWQNGDKIYIIGFSRGAYIARAIAGLVADHGLLTKRGRVVAL